MSDPATSSDIASVVKEVHGVHNDVAYYGAMLAKKLDTLISMGGLPAASASPQQTTATAVAPVVADPVAAKYFPPSFADAAFPSPENSRQARLDDGTVGGKPYLLDSKGSRHSLVPVSATNFIGYTVNGSPAGGGGNNPNDTSSVYQVLMVRQGQVYAQRAGGQWQHFEPDRGSIYNSGLPDAWSTDTAGATTSTVATSNVKAGVLPARMSPAPGTSGKTLTVGTGKAFTTITDAVKAATAGDTVAIDAGTYKETPPALTVPLRIVGVGGPFVVDCTGLTASLARGKGCFVPAADCIIENGRITGVALDQVGAQLTSGVRPDVGCGYLVLKDVEIDGNQSGLGTGGDLLIEITCDGGHFHHNGLPVDNDPVNQHGRGYAHNIYTGGGTKLILKGGFSSTDPDGGHAVKHRGDELTVSGGGTFDATEAAVFDIPQGTVPQATIDGVVITKPAGSVNHAVIDYASESTTSGNGGLLIKNTTINALCDSPFMLIGSGSVVTVDPSTKVTGNKMVGQGGKLVGI